MRVTLLDVGSFTSPAGLWRRDDPMDQQVRFPVPAYVIETDEERILVDTGLHPAAAEDPVGHYDSETMAYFELELQASVAERVDLSTITKVVLTHLHWDHAGGLALLPESLPIYVQRREWQAGHDVGAVERNHFRPRDYQDIDERIVLVDGDHDLLGDGSIELLFTPGHTPGHQSIRVGETIVLGGDVTHYASGLDDHRFPIFADDFAAQAASADRLRVLRDAGALVQPGHDPNVLVAGPIEQAGP